MEILILAVVLGLIPAYIARKKGYDYFFGWWVFGSLLFIVALPVALLIKPDIKKIEKRQLSEGMKKCPFCAEMIKQESIVCRYCGKESDVNIPQSDPIDKFKEEIL